MTTFINEIDGTNLMKEPTKLLKTITRDGKLDNPIHLNHWDYAELKIKGELIGYDFDIICCYDNKNDGCLYLGHWNDGC